MLSTSKRSVSRYLDYLYLHNSGVTLASDKSDGITALSNEH